MNDLRFLMSLHYQWPILVTSNKFYNIDPSVVT